MTTTDDAPDSTLVPAPTSEIPVEVLELEERVRATVLGYEQRIRELESEREKITKLLKSQREALARARTMLPRRRSGD